MGLFRRNREDEVFIEGRRLAATTAASLATLKDLAGQLNKTADKMAESTARLQGEQ